MIRLSDPIIDSRQIRAVKRVLKSGQLVQGPEVEAFEREVATYIGVPHAVAVNSGTSALHLGMLAAGVGPGDEVIVPSFSFAATANAVVLTGAKPVFGDISLDDYNLDPDHVESLITSSTRAVMVVHLYGQPAKMQQFERICRKHQLLLFEDAAQALGARIGDRSIGTWGSFSALSFYATKNVSSGEGGMVVTGDGALARRVRLLRNQGQEVKYRNEVVGFNNRLSDIHAAIGRQQLRHIESWSASRKRNADLLSAGLRHVVTPFATPNSHHAFHQYTIRVPAQHRDGLMAHLHNCGVQSAVYYPTPIHRLPSFASGETAVSQGLSLPITEKVANEALSLPVQPRLTRRELKAIIQATNSYHGWK
jgi:dTDP-4-amino-4,6-dideoxygalactose transaminase